MNDTDRPTSSRAATTIFSALLAGCLLSSATAADAADRMVVASGLLTDFGDRTNRNPGSAFGGAAYSLADFCSASDTVAMAMGGIIDRIDQAATEGQSPITASRIEMTPGAPTRRGIESELATARDSLCRRDDPEATTEPFAFAYSSCSMSMVTPRQEMLINLPPGGGSAEMWMLDQESMEASYLELTESLGAVSEVIGKGWSDAIDLRDTGESERISNIDTRHYEFSYTSGLGMPGGGAPADAGRAAAGSFGNLITVESTGDAWIAPDAAGADIVESFYRNLTGTIQAGQTPSFFSGFILNAVVMLEKGMPIRIEQTTSSKMMGRTTVSGTTQTLISNIRLVDLHPDWCGLEMQIPDAYRVTDINEQMSEAMEDAPSAAEINAAMQEYQEAMNQMTDEQRQMLQQMGMGDRMQQAMGGAAPGAQPGAAGSAMPPSEQLQSDNLTQSVQQHLQALGYDVGAADGEPSMQTTIAISTFQAERGMEVTGEVTPQLLGILSAEVDSRR